jgi:hypothetical protein
MGQEFRFRSVVKKFNIVSNEISKGSFVYIDDVFKAFEIPDATAFLVGDLHTGFMRKTDGSM